MKKTAVILVNLGTPEAPTPKAVGKFLKQFLSDSRVVEAPKWLWWILLRAVIIPFRAKKVAHAYRAIWWKEGSPLRVISSRQKEALQVLLDSSFKEQSPLVVDAMTYGEPSIASTIEQLQKQGVEYFVVVPMYPQYSCSTTAAIYDQLADVVKGARNVPDIYTVKSFYDQPDYIDALADSVRAHWNEHGRKEKLLMSFHGIPQEYADKGDPYPDHCLATAKALAVSLQLSESEWTIGYQSRFGPKQWLQPYTDSILTSWASDGIRSVDIISPAFTADCLETLEELNINYRNLFLNSGGSEYSYIPCVNDSPIFIDALSRVVKSAFLNYQK